MSETKIHPFLTHSLHVDVLEVIFLLFCSFSCVVVHVHVRVCVCVCAVLGGYTLETILDAGNLPSSLLS